jgi:hypothetical protein
LVVIRARLEPEQLVGFGIPGGQHQDRNVTLGSGAQATTKRPAIEPRQPDIQHNDIMSIAAGEPQATIAVARIIHRVATRLEELPHGGRQIQAVFNEKNVHGNTLALQVL